MEELYERILKMRELQEDEAGPFFAELSTPDTWIELLRWMLKDRANNFQDQMTEVAAMALWALQAAEDAAAWDAVLENEEKVADSSSNFHPRFGPLDRPLGFHRDRRLY